MQEFVSFRSRGQTIVLVAIVALALIAFVALAVDGGNVYGLRREAQSASDGAAIAGTWVMVEYKGASPGADILFKVNQYAQQNGVPDTNGNPDDIINDNVLAYYVYFDGSCVPSNIGEGCWELHSDLGSIPADARGIHVWTHVSSTTFFARAVGISTVEAQARATARFEPDGGLLPIAVNEYWMGNEGQHCPYPNCGEPFSFVRNPEEAPPFTLVSSDPEIWDRNECPNSLNDYYCEGPYGDDAGENFGKAFAILGADAKPNHGSNNPRSGVMLDCRYDALNVNDGDWWYLLTSDNWRGPNDECPMNDGDAAAIMAQVILAGGYQKLPLPRPAQEPPYDPYINDWGYCWDSPPDNCFNSPLSGRPQPYDTLQFLNGSKTNFWAGTMYDGGLYVDGRYRPGERVVILAYNSNPGDMWGAVHKADTAVAVGYFGARIVGYGTRISNGCSCSQWDWECFHDSCISGQPNTVYALADPNWPLVIDPTRLLEEFLPKHITLIKGTMDE